MSVCLCRRAVLPSGRGHASLPRGRSARLCRISHRHLSRQARKGEGIWRGSVRCRRRRGDKSGLERGARGKREAQR
eukprot:2568235-Pleurochrysis_carterae.AAC.1